MMGGKGSHHLCCHVIMQKAITWVIVGNGCGEFLGVTDRYKRLNFSTKFSIFFGEVNTNVISDSEPIDWIAGLFKKYVGTLTSALKVYSTRRESSPCPKTAAYVMISVSTSVQWELTRGRSRGTHPAPPLLKLEKIKKIGVIFPTKYPQKILKCAPPPPSLKSWIRPC